MWRPSACVESRAMDTPALIGIGLAAAVGVAVAMQRKRNQKLAPAIETALRAEGVLALNDMLAEGKVRAGA
jgi:hypothetical protein